MIQLVKICNSLFFILAPIFLNAQNDTLNTSHATLLDSAAKKNIRNIIVSGNKITKNYLVLREIPFKINDSIAPKDFAAEFEQARQLIYNTTLFNEVKLTPRFVTDFDIDIFVEVKERWYIYPIPQFLLVDRNVNEWIKIHNANLNRVNYGLKFVNYNLSGRRDQLRISLLNGYSKNIVIGYAAPYSNKALTEGFTLGAVFSQTREMPYKTDYNNRILLFKQEGFVKKNWFATAGYIVRRGYFVRHFFSAAYTHVTISDSILKQNFNPNYFKKPVTKIGFPDFFYTLQYTKVDNSTYPLQGKIAYLAVMKRGISFSAGPDMLAIEAGVNRYWILGKKWYSSIQLNTKIKLPFDQAYINQRGFGYVETYLRGLEYYVVDGVATALLKSTIKKKLLYFNIPFPIKSKSHPKIPFTIFAKTYADAGYVYNKKKFDTFLNNKLLYTAGLGIDIFTLYDISARFEYSFNQLNQKGLFLHIQSAF
jgi:outer membrane protein assembly factor BamA